MLINYTLDGFKNIQHQENYSLQEIIGKLTDLYRLYGYRSISTPTFEAYDLYVNEDSIPCDDLFKLVNHRGKVLVLKPDATLPVTRMAALNHPNPDEIIKFCYDTNIYRNFSTPEIIKKEITQMGIEYFGNNSPECDGEVIGLSIFSLLKNGIKDVHIDIGHVGFINALFEELNLEEVHQKKLNRYIENKNIGDIITYLEPLDLEENAKEMISKLPKLYGEPKEVLRKMDSLCLNQKMSDVILTISEIFDHLEIMGLSQYISFDLGFTNQMNYYSDITFKGYINHWGEPVINGGRYDHLSQKFGIPRPACGFAIDLLKIMDYMEQENLLTRDTKTKNIIFYDSLNKAKAYDLANQCRKNDQITEVFLIKDDWGTLVKNIQNNVLYENSQIYFLTGTELNWVKGNQYITVDKIKGEQA